MLTTRITVISFVESILWERITCCALTLFQMDDTCVITLPRLVVSTPYILSRQCIRGIHNAYERDPYAFELSLLRYNTIS